MTEPGCAAGVPLFAKLAGRPWRARVQALYTRRAPRLGGSPMKRVVGVGAVLVSMMGAAGAGEAPSF